MARKHTIDDIARLAGVSKATVSRVLNHKPDVDPTTRTRILRIVEEQGFVPSIAAAGLASGHSRLIGVLIPAFTWPLIPDVMRGIAQVIGMTSYELVLYSMSEPLRLEKDRSDVIDRILATKLTTGLLAIYPGQSTQHVARLHSYGFPVVIIDDQELPTGAPWVGSDNRNGAYGAVRHLISLGHRRIAHIQGPKRYLCSRERCQGYYQALEEEGLSPDPALIVEGDFETLGGYYAARQLFDLPCERRPTAIFAGNDPMAYGVLSAAQEYGLRVPEEIALVGFDDISSAAHVQPALTTVRQPFYEMGQRSIELLLSMLNPSSHPTSEYDIGPGMSFSASSPALAHVNDGMNGKNGKHAPEPVRIQLATSLVVRASCGAPCHLMTSSSEEADGSG